jgi:hypothetical protein
MPADCSLGRLGGNEQREQGEDEDREEHGRVFVCHPERREGSGTMDDAGIMLNFSLRPE